MRNALIAIAFLWAVPVMAQTTNYPFPKFDVGVLCSHRLSQDGASYCAEAQYDFRTDALDLWDKVGVDGKIRCATNSFGSYSVLVACLKTYSKRDD